MLLQVWVVKPELVAKYQLAAEIPADLHAKLAASVKPPKKRPSGETAGPPLLPFPLLLSVQRDPKSLLAYLPNAKLEAAQAAGGAVSVVGDYDSAKGRCRAELGRLEQHMRDRAASFKATGVATCRGVCFASFTAACPVSILAP
jgi:hypothetical protein